MSECFNCGLPDAAVRAKVKLKAENSFRRDSLRTLPFCSEECAVQAMFIQLPTRSTPDSIARFLGSRPVTLAGFRSKVAVEEVKTVKGGLACYETDVNEKMTLPTGRNFGALETPKNGPGVDFKAGAGAEQQATAMEPA